MTHIRHLEPELINRIAAGEVVERPASVIKELVENALDASATHITLTVRQGGHSFICVEDNGTGMSREDLILSVQRHTTSKLPSSDLWHLKSFGFRGEALAAITSIARVTVQTGHRDEPHGWSLQVDGGVSSPPSPLPFFQGTRIDVKDLFFATPARLKFLRSAAVEYQHILEGIEKIALMHPSVTFSFEGNKRPRIYPQGSPENRIAAILGDDFIAQAIALNEHQNGYELWGYIGLPTYNRASADKQFFYANRRPIRDKLLSACLRMAFSDTLPRDRFPVAVLFLTVPPEDLDVNVHPAKTEVRFRDISSVRQFVLGTLKKYLFTHGHRVLSLSPSFLDGGTTPPSDVKENLSLVRIPPVSSNRYLQEPSPGEGIIFPLSKPRSVSSSWAMAETHTTPSLLSVAQPLNLGAPLGQIQDSYILAQGPAGLVLVDPHAAHERIVFERLKSEWGESLGVIRPFLLSLTMPLTASEQATLSAYAEPLRKLGFDTTHSDAQLCHLKSVPELFKDWDPLALFRDILSLLSVPEAFETLESLIERLRNGILANWGCRASIWLGKSLSLEEMNVLLRTMECTPNIAQCNHGRPTYRIVSLAELGRLFHRN